MTEALWADGSDKPPPGNVAAGQPGSMGSRPWHPPGGMGSCPPAPPGQAPTTPAGMPTAPLATRPARRRSDEHG
jgi:hypothetical protein